MTALPGNWDADHDRPRTRNIRLIAQCTHINFVLVNPPLSACRYANGITWTGNDEINLENDVVVLGLNASVK